MKLIYDKKANAMYIYLLSGKKITRTEELREDVMLDYSGKELVGIEILDASDKLSEKNLNKLSKDSESLGSAAYLHKVSK